MVSPSRGKYGLSVIHPDYSYFTISKETDKYNFYIEQDLNVSVAISGDVSVHDQLVDD